MNQVEYTTFLVLDDRLIACRRGLQTSVFLFVFMFSSYLQHSHDGLQEPVERLAVFEIKIQHDLPITLSRANRW